MSGSWVAAAGTLSLQPTTTLAAQTSNNTSAANTFLTQSNGNVGAGNVSKVNVHSLLYPGATTKIYAHLVLWFGASNHMDVGYTSWDPAQVHRQVLDMIDRGIDGVIIDWYGPGNAIDQATQLVMAEAEAHPGFTFAITVDKGAIQWNSCSGCTAQQALIQQLQYVEQTYFPSPAYLRQGGVPVVSNFDIDLFYTIDWTAVAAALPSNPVFLFQNDPGFTHVLSGGSFSWVMPSTTDLGVGYLTDFYSTGLSFPKLETVGAAYKGFNDSLAAWGSGRIMSQGCGQTWLKTFSTINSLYNSSQQLPALQLVAWNDYEEGTEIESGIDNCVAVAATISGGSLQWSASGDESTVDHYIVYVSSDGQNLMPLAELASGTNSLDVCSFSLAAGPYTLFVQAVGKPNLTNHMSGSVAFTAPCLVAPALLAPTAGSNGISTTPTFSWTAVTGAGGYRLAVATSSTALPQDPAAGSCTGCVIDLTVNSAGTTSITPATTLSAGKTYYWEVQAFNPTSRGPWSAVFSFTTAVKPSRPSRPPRNGTSTSTSAASSASSARGRILEVSTSATTLKPAMFRRRSGPGEFLLRVRR